MREQTVHCGPFEFSQYIKQFVLDSISRADPADETHKRLLLIERADRNLEAKILLPIQISDSRRCALERFRRAIEIESVQVERNISRIKYVSVSYAQCCREVAGKVGSRIRRYEQTDSADRLLWPPTGTLDNDIPFLKFSIGEMTRFDVQLDDIFEIDKAIAAEIRRPQHSRWLQRTTLTSPEPANQSEMSRIVQRNSLHDLPPEDAMGVSMVWSFDQSSSPVIVSSFANTTKSSILRCLASPF